MKRIKIEETMLNVVNDTIWLQILFKNNKISFKFCPCGETLSKEIVMTLGFFNQNLVNQGREMVTSQHDT